MVTVTLLHPLNCFFKNCSQTFREVIGIPMGSDPEPFFANIILLRHESEWIGEMKMIV